jgi:cytochrome oxidase Cu insertion factor (SCO1/SenC/PrrC family)
MGRASPEPRSRASVGYPYDCDVLRWALLAAVALASLAALSLRFVLHPSEAKPAPASVHYVTWAEGQQQAPPIVLRTAEGAPFRLAALRGRPAIVTFVDPHCTTFCPRESLVIDDAVRTLPLAQRPAIVAVNVDPTVTAPRVFRQEAKRLRWLPQWRWATGSHAVLARVWRSYHVEVIPTKDDISHTELAYVVDANGDERALLLWPFHASDVSRALASASS